MCSSVWLVHKVRNLKFYKCYSAEYQEDIKFLFWWPQRYLCQWSKGRKYCGLKWINHHHIELQYLKPQSKQFRAVGAGLTTSFNHCVACLMRGPCTFREVLHRARPSDSSFKFQYFAFYLRSFSGCLCLILRFPVTSTFPSGTCFDRQLLCQIWPTQLNFRLCFARGIILPSSPLWNTSSFVTRSIQLVFSILTQQHISKLPTYFWFTIRIVQSLALYKVMLQMLTFH